MSRLAIAIVAALFAISPTLAVAGTPTEVSQQWAADWSAKKLDAVMAFYGPDPVFLSAVGPRWQGTATLRKNFAGLLAMYNPHTALSSLKSETSGDLAYDSGSYAETIVPVKGGKTIRAKGNYVFIFQRQKSGEWKILEQTWTEDEPVAL